MKTLEIDKHYKIDTYKVSQYEEKRVVDIVKILTIYRREVLCYSPYLRADVLIPKSEVGEQII
jgi:hypothetical protein